MKYLIGIIGTIEFVFWLIIPHIKTGDIYFWKTSAGDWAPLDFVENYDPAIFPDMPPEGLGKARVLTWFGLMFILCVYDNIDAI